MAGAGYMVGKTFSLAAGATQDLRPSTVGLTDGTNEMDIHNIYYNGQIQISTYDGTNLNTFKTDTAAGALMGMCSHCNGVGLWLQVKNTGSSTLLVTVDGVQTQ